MKRAVVGLCALCMLITIVGCGSDADSSQSTPKTDTETRAIGVIDVEKNTDIENSSLTETVTPSPTSEPTENDTPEPTETPVQTSVPQVEEMVATEKVNVREQPNTDCNILGKLTGGESISVYETMSDGWSRVDYNGTEGYVKTEFLTTENDYQNGVASQKSNENTKETEANTQSQDAGNDASNVVAAATATVATSTATNGGSGGGDGSNFDLYDNAAQQNTSDTYVLNTSTMKIHHPSCKSVKKIAPQNYSTSNSSIQELQAMGYSLCGNCF